METIIDTDGQVLTKATLDGYVSYRNSKCEYHRIDGPAVIGSDGTVEYWVDGKLHRTEGPAIIWSDGIQEYWVDGIEYTEDEYPKAVLEYKLEQTVG